MATFPGVFVEEQPSAGHPIPGVATSITAFVGYTRCGIDHQAQRIPSFADYERQFGGLAADSELSYAVRHFFENGGAEACVVRVPRAGGAAEGGLPGTAELIGDPSTSSGIYALDTVDLFNLLSIPDATRAAPGDPAALDPSVDPASIYAAAAAYCQARRAMLLVDAPPDVNDVASATDWIGRLPRDANAAAFFPRLVLADPLDNDAPRPFAPSGVVAGVYARTDAARGVWKAPAGVTATLVGVRGVTCELSDRENSVLNGLGLNCARVFPVYGPVLWGARTLRGTDAGADEWTYVNIRRLALYIEESLSRGTQWAVFEPNEEPLWARLRLDIGAFLHGLFQEGAFAGTTPQSSYLVRCGRDTMTQDDIDRGTLNVVVGVALVKPAEFVIVQIQHTVGQSQTTTVASTP